MGKGLMIFALVSIWISVIITLLILFGAVRFLLRTTKQSSGVLPPLKRYPKITIVVPAHNEELVIQDTVTAILNLNYPKEQMEIKIVADNCEDHTFETASAIANEPQYKGYAIEIVNRKGSGGKAGVLNDMLTVATGEWICVYDADAMPEANALYFLVSKALEDEKNMAKYSGGTKREITNKIF